VSRPVGPAAGAAAEHPLAGILRRAAAGDFPAADGAVDVLPPYRAGVRGMVSFTGHAVAVTHLPLAALLAAGADGFAGATAAPVTALLAGPDGVPDVLDALLAGVGRGPLGGPGAAALPARDDLTGHPRVSYARQLRDDVRVHGDDRGLVTLARGLGGLTEISFEVPADRRGRGHGRGLLADALHLVPAGEPVLAAVAPGNAASLRSLLAAGFAPIGSVQLILVPETAPAG
jgi:hypothetical protein